MSSLQITDARVREAIHTVSRQHFLASAQQPFFKEDRPIDIGYGQTTSQPSLIAWMIQILELEKGAKVLEVGTGSGYQTALLAELQAEVYSVEIIAPLAARAAATLNTLGYRNVRVRHGDGYMGWPEAAPFAGIIVSAGARCVPQPLVEQLDFNGRLIIPLGNADAMHLFLYQRDFSGNITCDSKLPVCFVPFAGLHADADRQSFN